jgi:hypothetical protein
MIAAIYARPVAPYFDLARALWISRVSARMPARWWRRRGSWRAGLDILRGVLPRWGRARCRSK